MYRQITSLFILAGALTTAHAVDGVIELNDTCAQATGCVDGDAAGYPITIATPGSYVLTSSLFVGASEDAIVIANPQGGGSFTFDLNGYAIEGPGTSGSGRGFLIQSNRATIRDGFVRGTGSHGVTGLLGTIDLRGVQIEGTGGSGVTMGTGGKVSMTDSEVLNSLRYGIELSEAQATLSNSRFYNNEIGSFNSGGPVFDLGGNRCDDSLCDPAGRKKFYLTQTTHTGGDALAACDAGYHMASLWEIYDVSNVFYDMLRGRTADDSGFGPPTQLAVLPGDEFPFRAQGWVRTGSESQFGQPNCAAYTTSSSSSNGTVAGLQNFWIGASAEALNPWDHDPRQCNFQTPVWCVQD